MKRETMQELYKDFEVVSEREGFGGLSFKYIKGATIINRLNMAFKNAWSFEVIDVFEKDSFVVVHGRLSVLDDETGFMINRDAFGSRVVDKFKSGARAGTPIDLGHAYKGATTDALKKAASMLGVGLQQLYDVDEEELDEQKHEESAKVAPQREVRKPLAEDFVPELIKSLEPQQPKVEKPAPILVEQQRSVEQRPVTEKEQVTKIQPVQKISIERNAKMKGLNVPELIRSVLGAEKSIDSLTWSEAVQIIRETGKARVKGDAKESMNE